MRTHDTWKSEILDSAAKRGPEGYPKSRFGNATRSKVFREALAALIKADRIRVQMVGKSQVLFLPCGTPDPEKAAITLESHFSAHPNEIFTRNDLKRTIQINLRPFLNHAIELLVADKRLATVSHGKRSYFVHISSFGVVPADHESDLAAILTTHQELRQDSRFAAVAIATLIDRTGIRKEQIHDILLDEAKHGRATLSIGDWSLASAETKGGALEVGGERFLHVILHERS
ncbi:MAG: hypothetical protein ACI8T1_003397 [Verrucomicrobiales bacterium]|jgi:hypothetical protein